MTINISLPQQRMQVISFIADPFRGLSPLVIPKKTWFLVKKGSEKPNYTLGQKANFLDFARLAVVWLSDQ